jgi:hypothetical protein
MDDLDAVLSDEGWLLLTFLNEGPRFAWDGLAGGEPWDPDRVGMAVFGRALPWEAGGPRVFLSEWWLRARWGRAFEIERLETREFGGGTGPSGPGTGFDQGFVLLRKRPGVVAPEDLRRPEPDEPREATAALAEVERIRRELERVGERRRRRKPVRARAVALRRRVRRH